MDLLIHNAVNSSPQLPRGPEPSAPGQVGSSGRLAEADIQIRLALSLPKRWTVADGMSIIMPFGYNIFVERLWHTVKYENIYLNDYDTGLALFAGLAAYFDFYNHERFRQSLNYQTSAQVYGKSNTILVE